MSLVLRIIIIIIIVCPTVRPHVGLSHHGTDMKFTISHLYALLSSSIDMPIYLSVCSSIRLPIFGHHYFPF